MTNVCLGCHFCQVALEFLLLFSDICFLFWDDKDKNRRFFILVENGGQVLDIGLHILHSDCNVKLYESAFEPTAQRNQSRLFSFTQNVRTSNMIIVISEKDFLRGKFQ